MPAQPKCGILLANTGTPALPTRRAIGKFLGRFLIDDRIVPTNKVLWWFILHFCIIPVRSKRNVEKYEAIWTEAGNPSTIGHEMLVSGLSNAFAQDGFDNVKVVCGMSYSDPDIHAALQTLKDAECEQVFVLPLYPQSAHSTTGAVYDALERAMSKLKWDVPCQLIDNYHDNPMYIRAIAASIKRAGFDPDSDDKILFSFHSIPLKDVEAGDTYELQTGASSLQIASELGIDRKRWTISYQCRFDKGREWLSPYTSHTLERWAESGSERVFFICPGFAVDCLETLFDIKHELEPFYRSACEEAGRPCAEDGFIYVPCLDRSKAHVQVLHDVLHPFIKEL